MSRREDYSYPEDEFDIAGASGGPEGVHRAARSTARKVTPWIVVLLIVPLLAFAVVFVLSQNDPDLGSGFFGDDDDDNSSQTEPAAPGTPDEGDPDSDGADGDPEADTDAEAPEEPAEPDEPDPEPSPPPVDRTVKVDVLNATQISGLAALGVERLAADGWTGTSSGNFTGSQTRQNSVVKYTDPELETSAHELASVLGIDDVIEDPDAGEGLIVELWQGLD